MIYGWICLVVWICLERELLLGDGVVLWVDSCFNFYLTLRVGEARERRVG